MKLWVNDRETIIVSIMSVAVCLSSFSFRWSTNVHIYYTVGCVGGHSREANSIFWAPRLRLCIQKSAIFFAERTLKTAICCVVVVVSYIQRASTEWCPVHSWTIILGTLTWNIPKAPVTWRLSFVFPGTPIPVNIDLAIPRSLFLPQGWAAYVPWLWRVSSDTWLHMKPIFLKMQRVATS